MACDFNCWFPGISGFLLLGVRMWTFRLKKQGVCDTGDERLICCCKGIQAWGHACPKVSSSCAAWACQCCHPSSPQLLGMAGKLHWDGLSKLPARKFTRMVILLLNWTLWQLAERWPLEIWDFDDSCALKDCLLSWLWVSLCFEGLCS